MFSSFLSTISSYTSPKAVLSSYLAKSLSVFFDVDPTLIESNLVSDTKVVVKNVRLKPLLIDGTDDLEIVGIVDEIEFSWFWGGSTDGSTSIVRDTRLTIRGAKFRIQRVILPRAPESAAPSPSASGTTRPASTTTDTSSQQSYIQRHVQQIIDHLTLNITDMELTVEVQDVKEDGKAPMHQKSLLVVQVLALQLMSLGRQQQQQKETRDEESLPSLSQRISLGSLRVDVKIADSSSPSSSVTTSLPLIEPFGYAALVKRVSGRRFIDGIAHGLEIVGENMNDPIRIHAGKAQVKLLGLLMDSVLSTTTPPHVARDTCAHATSTESTSSVINEGLQAPPGTVFLMPLPAISVTLPNGSSIDVPCATLRYRTDGSEFQVQGTDGIRVNKTVPVIKLESTTKWSVDLLKNRFCLQQEASAELVDEDEFYPASESDASSVLNLRSSSSEKGSIASMHWHEEPMKSVALGIQQVLTSTPAQVLEKLEALQENMPASTSDAVPLPWSVLVDGSLLFRVESSECDGKMDWLELSTGPLSVVISPVDMLPTSLTLAGCSSSRSSLGELFILVPLVTMRSDSKEIVVDEPIKTTFQSIEQMDHLKDFLISVFDVDFGGEKTQEFVLPLSINLTDMTCELKEPRIKLVVQKLLLCESTATCESVKVSANDGAEASLSSVRATFEKDIQLLLLSLDVHYPGMLDLDEPVETVSIRFRDGSLDVSSSAVFASIAYTLSDSTTTSSENKGLSLETDEIIPFPACLRLPQVKLRMLSNEGEKAKTLTFGPIDISANSSGSLLTLQVQALVRARLSTSDGPWLDFSIGTTSMDLALLNSVDASSLKQIESSGFRIGPSSFGDISLVVPPVALKEGSTTIFTGGPVDISVTSLETLYSLRTMFQDCLSEPVAAPSSRKSIEFPFTLSLSAIKLQVTDPGLDLSVSNIQLSDKSLNMDVLQMSTSDGLSADMHGISARTEPTMQVTVDTVAKGT